MGANQLVGLALLTVLLAGPAGADEDVPDLQWRRFELRLDGYIRAGLGTSRSGATQAAFAAPGARAKYRLGNEPETYFELGADGRYRLGDTPDTPTIQGYFLTAGYAPMGRSFELGINDIVQAYFAFDNFWPGFRVWLGRRYYERKDIHLNDYFWLNPGQGAHAGLGLDRRLKGGSELKAVVFRLEDSEAPEGGVLNSTTLDLRLAGLRTNSSGVLTLWGQYALRHRNTSASFPERNGFGLGFWHDQDRVFGLDKVKDTVAVLYRHGAALTQGPTNARPVREDQGYGLERARAWEINNSLLLEPRTSWSLQWGLVLRWEDRGLGEDDTVRWFSTGVRPLYYVTDFVHVGFELGYDHVDNEPLARSGGLTKATALLQLSRGRGYFTRPVLRLFATGAWWSSAFRGLIGVTPDGAPYGNGTWGWTVGSQLEAWW
ncbi:carbohydrate porin [Pyxidicoccus caerfyrddinensis]|uniref:carbohydrate porin n=1 Tax=Pyxidicoccus caerfyrddinensis TaxID=2709663 RepID=UPI0013DC0CB0|nr:carbohydrate porin [Pyxidicoccus caerfyrddinensis]